MFSLSKRIRAVKEIDEVRTENRKELGGAKGWSRAGGDSRLAEPCRRRRTNDDDDVGRSLPTVNETERVSERDGEKERQSGADPSDRPALTSTPTMERRRRHRRRQHRPVDSDVVTTMTTTNARILLLAPTPRRTRGWDTALLGRTPFISIFGPLFLHLSQCTHIHPFPSFGVVIRNPCFLDVSIAPSRTVRIIEREIIERCYLLKTRSTVN